MPTRRLRSPTRVKETTSLDSFRKSQNYRDASPPYVPLRTQSERIKALSPSIFGGLSVAYSSTGARRGSPAPRASSPQSPQLASYSSTPLAALSHSLDGRTSPVSMRRQQQTAQIQTGLVLHRTRSGSLASAQVSARANTGLNSLDEHNTADEISIARCALLLSHGYNSTSHAYLRCGVWQCA